MADQEGEQLPPTDGGGKHKPSPPEEPKVPIFPPITGPRVRGGRPSDHEYKEPQPPPQPPPTDPKQLDETNEE